MSHERPAKEVSDGTIMHPQRIDPTRLGTLRPKLRRGHGTFDIESFRDQPHDPALRE